MKSEIEKLVEHLDDDKDILSNFKIGIILGDLNLPFENINLEYLLEELKEKIKHE